jgi:K+-transporting ATPase ATPase C chain
MNNIKDDLKTAMLLFVGFTLLTGLVYPFLMTGIIQIALPEQASGSMIVVNGKIVGSELIGQNFTSPGYFHGRPSAVNYAGNGSGASNFGPTNKNLMEQVSQRISEVRAENNLSSNATVPGELVLTSGSGLDPHISMEGAMLQVSRVANARGIPESEVKVLVYQHIEPAQFGIMGQERVNVLNLNLALEGLNRSGH